MKGKYILILVVIIIVAGMLWNALSQPGVADLKGGFTEIASYRNENNTGPIQRVYAVAVTDTLWDEMQQYGDFMPYTKQGKTVVYFFLEGSPVPTELTPGSENFESEYHPYCIGVYEKNTSGLVSLRKYPFH